MESTSLQVERRAATLRLQVENRVGAALKVLGQGDGPS